MKPAASEPTICSVCRQPPSAYQHEDRPGYVDMESAYDGPVVKVSDTMPGVYVENIVICEVCIRSAARMIGMTDEKGTSDFVAALEADNDQLRAEEESMRRAISNLSWTVGYLIDHPISRPKGKPVFKGPDTHKAQIKELGSARLKAEKASKARKAASGADRD